MGKTSREKGRKAEGEVARLFRDHLGIEVRRILNQYREVGLGDLEGWDGVLVEVKRYARVTPGLIASWWTETLNEAGEGDAPILAYRGDGQAWTFRLRPADWGVPIEPPIDVDIVGLVAWTSLTERRTACSE